MKKIEREIRLLLKELADEGHTTEMLPHHKGHYRLRVDGRLFTSAGSPSCPHSLTNLRKDIRKYLSHDPHHHSAHRKNGA